MNIKKLMESKKKIRELTDEIRQLRVESGERDPQAGDVYRNDDGDTMLVLDGDNWTWLCGCGTIRFCTSAVATVKGVIKDCNLRFVGTFDDVFRGQFSEGGNS